MECAVSIEGDLNKELLKEALQNVGDDYEILRTTYRSLAEMTLPIQVIAETASPAIYEYDLSEVESIKREAELERIIESARAMTFDFEDGPVFHIWLVALSPEKNLMFLRLPALCADGVGMVSLARAIMQSYEALLNGERLSHDPVQHADLSEWLNELQESEETQAGRDYWRKFILPDLSSFSLPLQLHSRIRSRFRPASIPLDFDDCLLADLRSACHCLQASTSIFLLAAWYSLLSKLSARPDLAVACCFDGRSYSDLSCAVALLDRYLPVSVQTPPGMKFSELVSQLAASHSQHLLFQDYFCWELIERGEGAGDYWPYCFQYLDIPSQIEVGGLAVSIESLAGCSDRFDLKLSCIRSEYSISARLDYDEGSISRGYAEQIAQHLMTIINSAISDAEQEESRLPIVSPTQQKQLVEEFNRVDWPETIEWEEGAEHQCAHEMIERQARLRPDAVAVTEGQQSLSYGEMNRRANRVAWQLLSRGVGPEQVVGVCMRRSAEMVVAVLGVMKSGAAYAPVDSTNPKARVRQVIEGSGSKVVISDEASRGLVEGMGCEVITVGEGMEEQAGSREEDLEVSVEEGNLVYVIYTSGSSGKPKGVEVTHGAMMNYVRWGASAYEEEKGSGSPVQTPVGFDLTVTSLILPLVRGKEVEIVGEEEGIEGLVRVLRRARQEGRSYSVVKITPKQLEMVNELMKEGERGGSSRVIVVGGEALRREVVKGWVREGVRVVNEYGPTEATVGCIVKEVRGEEEEEGKKGGEELIGKPIRKVRVYVVGERGEIVGKGMEGEIRIGGEGLARGYRGEAGETAERFVPDEYGEEEGGRVYRTGDMGRWREGGEMEYEGRRDEQVKVRGYRVEIGEVEAVMKKEEGVKECVVVAQEGEGREKRIVGYVVEEEGAELRVSEVRKGMREKLPEYMVPAVIVKMERLPMTGNGKVDRRALPVPDQTRESLEELYKAPRTSLEILLAEIWQELLGIDKVGINDNFFELGGDSILSVQVVARCNQAGLALTPKQIFQHQSICELATVVGTSQSPEAEQDAVTGYVPLTPMQRWFFWREITDPHHFNQAVMLRVAEPVEPALIEQAVAEIVSHHDALRARFHRQGEGWVQEVAADNQPRVVTRIELSGDSQQQRRQIETIAQQAQESLDLEQGPIIRVVIYARESLAVRVLMIIHHLAVDGVSWRVLIEDLQSCMPRVEIRAGGEAASKDHID